MGTLRRSAAFCFAVGLSLSITACGGGGGGNTTPPPPTTYTLTVNSANPASGVSVTVSPADNNSASNGATSFTRTYNSGTSVTLTAPATAGGNNFSSWSGSCTSSTTACTVAMNGNAAVTANYVTPVQVYTLTVNSTNPSSGVVVGAAPADNSGAASGTTSFTLKYNAGAAVTLTAPAIVGRNTFASWTGCAPANSATCNVTMSADTAVTAGYANPPIITPTVTVTPLAFSITALQPLTVTVAVSGGAGNPTATGSVVLSSGTYSSAAATLTSGSAQIIVPAGTLTTGSHTLKATYTPDLASSATYNTASGTSAAVTVVAVSTVAVSTPGTPLTVTDQILGMNLAAWYDVAANKTAIVNAFKTAGIKSVRWPGGSWSDIYHWATNTNCFSNLDGSPNTNDTFANFVSNIAIPGGLDVALTADYGTNAACTGGGAPAEAAAWVAAALALPNPITVSHMTVGNENYGSWEEDLHAAKNDATTYAAAVTGSGGYYQSIKTASSNTKVGVVVDEDNTTGGWDNIVLANAKGSYDFVEYHYYPQGPGGESDSYLVNQAAQDLTKDLKTVKAELTNWGTPNTPIFVGEIGSVYTLPGRQSSSITQALYAGQVLGEMMNDGVARANWWIGFGGCDDTNSYQTLSNGTKQYANFNTPGFAYQTNVYGWQDYGGYMVFSDGLPENGCGNETVPVGTLLPTARAFQLFSNVAVNGEHVLTPAVAGDTTDVRAYAATHSGGTALVLFNLNVTTSEAAQITLSGQATTNGVTVITYDKSIYDLSGSPTGSPADPAGTSTWAGPTTVTLGAQSLPLTLTLTPWSMNVVLIQ
jgi:hypothetical protein